jgi:NAD(P)-dependent dehydrogenase (short-subunit alcohol dehydrogenase family)
VESERTIPSCCVWETGTLSGIGKAICSDLTATNICVLVEWAEDMSFHGVGRVYISMLGAGASSGIGKAICSELSDRGFRVYGSVRTKQEGDTVNDLGPKIHPLRFDVRDAAAVQAAAQEVCSYLLTLSSTLYSSDMFQVSLPHHIRTLHCLVSEFSLHEYIHTFI